MQVTEPVAQVANSSPVGSTDIISVLLSLLVVLAVIFVLAMILKRFNIRLQQHGDIRVLSSHSLGAKERLVVVQIGEDKLLLGVTTQSIQVLKELPEDFSVSKPVDSAGAPSLSDSFRQQLKRQFRR